MERNRKAAMTALTAAATSLLSLNATAAAPPEKATAAFRVSHYSEDDLDQDKVLEGSVTERYSIDVQHFNLLMPLGSRFAVGADVIRESMTGASPTGAIRVAPDDVRVTMSGASISEDRQDVTLGGSWYGDLATLSMAAGQSTENDYEADYYSLGAEFNFNQNNTTIGISASASDDVIEPTDAELFGRIRYAEKKSRSVYIGASQVITKNWLVKAGLGVNQLDGYLSDPYKAGSAVAPLDRRPEHRTQRAITLGSRYFIEPVETALRLDYRYFSDDWGIDSHTFDMGLARQFGERFHVDFGIRWYAQSEADFYEPYQVPEVIEQPEYFSMDYRLSPYGAISFNLSLKWDISEAWSIVMVGEQYQSGKEYAGSGVTLESPGTVDFTRASLGVEFRF